MSAPTDDLGEKWKGSLPSSSLILSHLRQRTISFKLVVFTTTTTCDSVFVVYLWTGNHHLFWWFTFNSTCRWVLPVSQLLTDWCLLSSSPHLLLSILKSFLLQNPNRNICTSISFSSCFKANGSKQDSCKLCIDPISTSSLAETHQQCLPKIFWLVCHFSRYVTSTSSLNS